MSPCRSKEKLTNVHDAASDIASHQVSVQAFKIRGRKHTPHQNAFAKARSEALNLIFQSLKHIFFGPIRDMTVSPSRVFTLWSP